MIDELFEEKLLLTEIRRIIRVNSKGQKIRKLKCKKGYKLGPSKKSCVPITGSQKAKKRLAVKKMLRTKRSKGAALRRRTNRKRLRALRKRKAFGVKNQR